MFVPGERSPRAFESIEEICNYLLGHKEVVDLRRRRAGGGKAVFLMFDEETEALAHELGLEVAFPRAALRTRLDSKIETTQIARRGGRAERAQRPRPGVAARGADGAGRVGRLGDDLVVQTPYGDSGQTTFFIASRADWDEHARRSWSTRSSR